MKNKFLTAFCTITLLIVSCGPSIEEKAAEEQRYRDSVALLEQSRADSAMAIQQATADSVKKADSLRLVEKAIKDSLEAISSARPKK